VNPSTGLISGTIGNTADTGSPYTVTVSAAANGASVSLTFTWNVNAPTVPPTIATVFGASAIPFNGTTSLTFTITNPNLHAELSGISFTDNLPSGLTVATPNGLTNTGTAPVTATAGSSTISLSGGTLAARSSFTITINIIGTSIGHKNNAVTVTCTEAGASNTSAAEITVNPPPLPVANPDIAVSAMNATVTAVAPGILGNDMGIGLTAILVTTTAHGALTLHSDGSYIYVPNHNFTGTDSFTYRDQDVVGQLSANAATVTLRVLQPTRTFLIAPVTWVLGKTLVFTAVVKPAQTAPVGLPTGQVVFTLDGVAQAPAAMVGNIAYFITSSLSAGPHRIYATYRGDGHFTSSDSVTLAHGVHAAIDLQLSVSSATPPSALVGQQAIYTITVHNNGPQTATHVTVLDTIAPGTVVTLAGSQGSSVRTATGARFDAGSLAAGRAATFTVTETLDPAESSADSVSIRADQADPIPAHPVAPTQWFLKIDGVTGEVQDPGHQGEIAVNTFTVGLRGRSPDGSGGVPTVFVTMQTNRASPTLFRDAATGKRLGQAVITFRRGGDHPADVLRYTLTGVIVSQFTRRTDAATSLPYDEIALSFTKITRTYLP
jgi:uncharacterized repeat protein (TIGR01451 family)